MTETVEAPPLFPRHDALGLLRKEFPANQINQLPKPYKKDSPKGNCRECKGYHGLPAAHLDYIGHAALTDRLLDADLEWTWEPLGYDEHGLPAFDKIGGLWIRLTVAGVTRLGYGHPDGKQGGNAIKEAIGDALRNAGMRFGAGLDLWHKGELHEVTEERGVQVDSPVVAEPADTGVEWARQGAVSALKKSQVPKEALAELLAGFDRPEWTGLSLVDDRQALGEITDWALNYGKSK